MSSYHSCLETFQSLAKQGFAKAYFPLSVILKFGVGELKNDRSAVYYAHLAFDWCFENQLCNDPEIWSDLGVIYHWGDVIEANKSLAYLWFTKAAEENNAQAQFFLGEFYFQGIYVEKDYKEGIYWYGKSTANGYVDFSCMLGLLARAKIETGIEIGCYGLGEMYGTVYYSDIDYKSAFYFYQVAAEQGNIKGQVKLGHCFENGLGVNQDYAQAIFLYERAAEKGSTDAQCCLGFLNEVGRYLEQNSRHAIFWYKKAAANANLHAQSQLRWMYTTTIKIENHPHPTLLDHFGITGTQIKEIPALIEQLNTARASFTGLSNDWYVLVNRYGYGLKAQLKDLLDKNLTTTFINSVTPANIYLAIKISSENDLLAVVTKQGRLLIFPVIELPIWNKDKDTMLIKIDTVDIVTGEDFLVSASAIPVNAGLKLIADRHDNRTRYIILKREDIMVYTDSIGKSGSNLPRGFNRGVGRSR